jgi:prevent-host-death family protein
MPASSSRQAAKPARRAPRKSPAAATGSAPQLSSVVNVHEAKTNLSRLLARVEAGEEITIARAGQPLARLVPHARAASPGPRVPGRFKGMFGPLTPEEAMAPLPPEYTGFVPSPTDPLHRP